LSRYQLITVDLDETLWPCKPVIQAAEQALYAWLQRQAQGLAAAHDLDSLRQHRSWVRSQRPDIAHDLTALRRLSLELLLEEFGYSAGLADEGMALFLEHRNRVVPFEDVAPVLDVLRHSHFLVSVTNGNADVERTPLRGHFHRSFMAGEVGASRPDPALFHAALHWTGVAPGEALHLGDDPLLDVEAARALGMDAVWVNRSGASWPENLPAPDLEVADLEALLGWLDAAQ
jgi:putative hydrolase of the HAD superfamily